MGHIGYLRLLPLTLVFSTAFLFYSCFFSSLLGETYQINYDGNGNTSGTPPVDSGKYFSGQEAIAKDIGSGFARLGNDFSGWNTQSDGSGVNIKTHEKRAIYSDIQLFAKWKPRQYLLSFDANGGIGTPPPSLTFTYGSRPNVANSVSISKSGNNFAGWMARQDGGGKSFIPNEQLNPDAMDTLLYAIWIDTNFTYNNATSIMLTGYSITPPGTLVIPPGVTDIFQQAFDNYTSISYLYLPKSVKAIGMQAFANDGNLVEIHIERRKPPTLDPTAFNAANPSLRIYVPAGCLADYQSAPGWSSYASIIFES